MRPFFGPFVANQDINVNLSGSPVVVLNHFKPRCGNRAGAQAEDGRGEATRPSSLGEEARPFFATRGRWRRSGEGNIGCWLCLGALVDPLTHLQPTTRTTLGV